MVLVGRRAPFWRATLLLLTLTLVFLVPPAAAHGAALTAAERAQLAVVRLATPIDAGDGSASCSGAVFHPAGYILTAYHCVGMVEGDEDSADLGLQPGDLYNPEGRVVVYRLTDVQRPPSRAFEARFLSGNPSLDVAVLKITRKTDPQATIPAPLPLGRADSVQRGDRIEVLGYPRGNGNRLITAEGQVRRLDAKNGSVIYDAITDHGHSGGPVVNAAGEIIGVHSARIGQAREALRIGTLISFAAPYVETALARGGDAPLSEITAAAAPETPAPAAPATPTTPPAGPTVGTPAVAAPPVQAPAASRPEPGGIVSIDTPSTGAPVSGVVTVRGWAIDPGSTAGTGIDQVHVYLDGESTGGGTLLGAARYGNARSDVAAANGGERFTASGFTFAWDTGPATAGSHTLYVYAHTATGWIFSTVAVTVGK